MSDSIITNSLLNASYQKIISIGEDRFCKEMFDWWRSRAINHSENPAIWFDKVSTECLKFSKANEGDCPKQVEKYRILYRTFRRVANFIQHIRSSHNIDVKNNVKFLTRIK